jgi:uncharacterized protein (DUF1684 family)
MVLKQDRSRMPHRSHQPRVLFLASLFALFASWTAIRIPAQTPPTAALPTPAGAPDDLAAWRAQREQQVSAPDGWLTLVGLEWLKPGVNSIGTAADNSIRIHADAPAHIGLLTVSGKPGGPATIQLLSTHDGFPPDLLIDGKPAREGPLATEGKPSIIAWHGLTMAVLPRGPRFALRIKDAAAPARAGFHGLNWFPPDAHFKVQALWLPFPAARVEKIPTVLGTTLDLPSPGQAEFMLGGVTYTLTPVIEDPNSDTLFFILQDATSKTTTYETARYLHTGLPTHGLTQKGILELDFNRLENPPCAYTALATCPLPPEKNRLPVALTAGEKRYTP